MLSPFSMGNVTIGEEDAEEGIIVLRQHLGTFYLPLLRFQPNTDELKLYRPPKLKKKIVHYQVVSCSF